MSSKWTYEISSEEQETAIYNAKKEIDEGIFNPEKFHTSLIGKEGFAADRIIMEIQLYIMNKTLTAEE